MFAKAVCVLVEVSHLSFAGCGLNESALRMKRYSRVSHRSEYLPDLANTELLLTVRNLQTRTRRSKGGAERIGAGELCRVGCGLRLVSLW